MVMVVSLRRYRQWFIIAIGALAGIEKHRPLIASPLIKIVRFYVFSVHYVAI
jgi:hypothetical protein